MCIYCLRSIPFRFKLQTINPTQENCSFKSEGSNLSGVRNCIDNLAIIAWYINYWTEYFLTDNMLNNFIVRSWLVFTHLMCLFNGKVLDNPQSASASRSGRSGGLSQEITIARHCYNLQFKFASNQITCKKTAGKLLHTVPWFISTIDDILHRIMYYFLLFLIRGL